MNASIDPIGWGARQADDPHAARAALDALVAGAIDADEFLRQVSALGQAAPDTVWETLSLLDQYYRLGKVKAELFQTLKSYLEWQGLGTQQDAAISVPMPLAKRASEPRRPVQAKRPPAPSVVPAAMSGPAAARHRRPGAARGAVKPAVVPAPREPASALQRSRTRSAPRSLAEGDVVRDRYRIVRLLGQGGVGTVYEAIDRQRAGVPNVSEKVAIKVLQPPGDAQAQAIDALRREFMQLQSLSHPNIVRAFEFDRDGESAFFTMELLSGIPLNRVIAAQGGRPMPRRFALAIVRDVGSALAHAHSRSVVHGDISPRNILVTTEGEVRVLDFGAARPLERGPWISPHELPQPAPLATPEYASCQLLEGAAPGSRDDMFAFACVAYLLLSGKHPFEGRTAAEARGLRMRPRRPDGLHRRQWQALRAALSFESDRRSDDFDHLLHELELRDAAARLPALSVLMTAAPRRGNGVVALAFVVVVAALVIANLWVRSDLRPQWLGARPLASVTERAAEAGGSLLQRIREAGAAAASTVAGAVAHARATAAATSAAPAVASDAAAPGSRHLDEPSTAAAPAGAAAVEAVAPVPASAAAAAAVTEDAVRVAPAPAAPTARVQPSSSSSAVTGKSRIDFAEATIDVSPLDPMARIQVRRKGNLRGEVSFTWWTEAGTAKAGDDFAAYSPHVEHIPDGKSGITLSVPVVTPSTRRDPRTFYVVMDEASPGATLGEHTLAMVTLPAAE